MNDAVERGISHGVPRDGRPGPEQRRSRRETLSHLPQPGRSQAVRIPTDFEFPGNRVLIHKDGKQLVIEPEPRRGLLDVLRSLPALGPKDALPDDRDAPLLAYKPVAL